MRGVGILVGAFTLVAAQAAFADQHKASARTGRVETVRRFKITNGITIRPSVVEPRYTLRVSSLRTAMMTP